MKILESHLIPVLNRQFCCFSSTGLRTPYKNYYQEGVDLVLDLSATSIRYTARRPISEITLAIPGIPGEHPVKRT